MTAAVVLDANVVVSAQLVRHSLAPSFRLFEACASGKLRGYASTELVAEYLAVLTRPALLRRHGLTEAEVREVVTRFAASLIVVDPPPARVEAPDPGDQHLWNLLTADSDLVLVTGDPPLLSSEHFPGRIFSPREFVARHLDTG